MSFFESLANSIEETIIAVDRNNKIIFVNRSGEELIRAHSKGVIGIDLASVFNKAPTMLPLVKKAVRELRPISGYNTFINIQEETRFDFTISPLIENDEVEGAVLVLRKTHDLPGRIDDQFDSLMYLLSSVAHEIKNPLAGIRGGAQLLRGKADRTDSRHLDVIIRETERLDKVVKSYLFTGRKPVFNEINIHELIEEALNVLEPELKVLKTSLVRSYDPSLPPIKGDEGKLLQALINIIKNAMEAMKKGGTLEIRTKPAYEYMVEKEKKVKRRFVLASFRDNGAGIAEGDLGKVFMPFFTRKKSGSGLGLAISSKIIRDHSGLIKIRSSKKRGTSVDIYLPFAG